MLNLRSLLPLLLCLLALPCAAANPKKPAPPNVLLVTIDTLRADHVGAYGYKAAETHNLDALAAQGVRFTEAYTPVPITLPSHATMMTGAYPMKTGMHDFSGNKLNPEQPTLAKIFHASGYATGAVVASAVLDSRFGLNSGFDFYYDNFDFSRLQESNLDAMERPANQVVDEALKWLAGRKTGPFFLWIHLYDPHYPYNPPAPYDKRFASSPYDGEIAFADSQLGLVLQYLKKRGLYDNTLIAVSGDHGEGLGEHGEKTHGFFIYDSTLHVPLIIKPASTSAMKRITKVVEKPVCLVDLMPTLLDLTGQTAPGEVQGKSLKPLIEGEDESVSPLYAESYLPRIHFDWSELRGLRREKYHFIDGPKPELYDLGTDPKELHNLYPQKPALSSEIRGLLTKAIRENTPDHEMAVKTSLDPAMMERLKSLGYAAVSGTGNMTVSNRDLPDPKDRIQTYELISEAIADSQHGNFTDSITKLKQTLKTEQNSVPVHYLLGLNYYRIHDFADSIREFDEVLQRSPDYALAVYYSGLAHGGNGDLQKAAELFERTLQLDDTNFAAAYNLGASYLKMKRVDDAVRALRRSVEINPQYAPGYKALGEVFFYQRNLIEAEAALMRAAQITPRDPQIFALLAQVYAAEGLPQKSRSAAAQAESLRMQGSNP